MSPNTEESVTLPVVDQNSASSRPHDRAASRLLPAGQLVPFILVTVLFFLWGIPNNLNDVLIRHFMKSFAISRFQAGLVQSAFYMGYFLLAMPAAFLMRRAGYKSGFVIGLVLFGAGAFLFWPAALAGSYGFFLLALFVIASGLSFLETASNPFIAQLGDPDSSERRLNFAQAFNPLGAITGALIGTVFIFSGIELTPQQVAMQQASHTYDAYLRSETLRVVKPYLVIGAIALIWAVLILRTKFPAIQSEHENESGDRGHLRDLFRYPHFLFAVVAQFFYVGAQVGTWSYFITYVQEYAHQSEKIAGYFLTGTLAAFGVGRFASAWLMRFIVPAKLMGAYCVANMILVAIAVYQLLHVPNVPNHIRARTEGPRTQHQARRLAFGDGDCWRRRSHAAHGVHLRKDAQPRTGIFRPLARLSDHRALFLLGLAAAERKLSCRLNPDANEQEIQCARRVNNGLVLCAFGYF